MKTRAAKFLAAFVTSFLACANVFAAPGAPEPAPVADQCLTTPREYTPPGTRWRYHVERSSGRRCWFLKDDVEKPAGKAAEPSTAATEEPAPAPSRKKTATSRSISDARAEFSAAPVEQNTRPSPTQSASTAASSAATGDGNQTSAVRSANMLAPAAATRWPDPMSVAGSTANPSAAPADPNSDARTTPPAKPQVMPRAVPPLPVSEKPMSLPMLITIVAGGFSVLAVLVSVFFAWRASRAARRTPGAPMQPEPLEQSRRPGDLYRERKRVRAQNNRRRAA